MLVSNGNQRLVIALARIKMDDPLLQRLAREGSDVRATCNLQRTSCPRKMRFDSALVPDKCAQAISELMYNSGADTIYSNHGINRSFCE